MMRWQIKRVAVAHRTGICPIGEASVIIAMSSAHRRDALEVRQHCRQPLAQRCSSALSELLFQPCEGPCCSAMQIVPACSLCMYAASCCLLQACAWAIDELKATVPIWKREVYEDGSIWKENAESRERLTQGNKV